MWSVGVRQQLGVVQGHEGMSRAASVAWLQIVLLFNISIGSIIDIGVGGWFDETPIARG